MKHHLSRREFVRDGATLVAAGVSAPTLLAAERAKAACTLENRYVKYSIGTDGRNLHFADKQDGKDYCAPGAGSAFARVKKDQKYHDASAVAFSDGRLKVEFGDSGVGAVIRATAHSTP